MSLGSFGKGALRGAKNYTKGYSDVQAKVRAATSNDELPPTGKQLNEISQLSYSQNDFVEIIEILDKRLNDKGKNWRHVYKSLAVIDYLLHSGSENVVLYFRQNLYVIKTLKEFQYVDEESGKDHGANVRLKAKDVSNLLNDEARLRETRRNRGLMRDRMLGKKSSGEEGDGELVNENNERRVRDTLARDPDDPVQRAMQSAARRGKSAEDSDLQKALKLSAQDEENRKKALAASSGMSLFDDLPAVNTPTSPNNNNNNNNNEQQLISLDDNTNASQFLQPQQTLSPQFTSFNPYQQQAQQEAMQAEYLRQQMIQQQAEQEWLQQQQMIQAQQQQQQAQFEQQQMFFQQQQQQQSLFPPAQQLQPQPTGFGSNNPFARSASPVPPLPASSFMSNNNNSTFSPTQSPTTPASTGSPYTPLSPGYPSFNVAVNNKPEHAQLANLFANRGDAGIDTFGNFGQLRFGPNQASQLAGRT